MCECEIFCLLALEKRVFKLNLKLLLICVKLKSIFPLVCWPGIQIKFSFDFKLKVKVKGVFPRALVRWGG